MIMDNMVEANESMIGKPVAIFRGDCLGYLLFTWPTKADDELTASISFGDITITVPVLSLYAFDQTKPLSVICFPLFPDNETLDIAVIHTPSSSIPAVIQKWTFKGVRIKWLSRLSYRTKKELAALIKGCEETFSATNALIKPLGVYPLDEDDLIARVSIILPHHTIQKEWEWGSLTDGKAANQPPILMKDTLKTVDEEETRTVVLSQRFPKTTQSLIFYTSSTNSNDPGFAIGFIPETLKGWLHGFSVATEDAGSDPDYQMWFLSQRATLNELALQKKYCSSLRMLFSVVMSVDRPSLEHLKDAINSLQAQSYPNWELIIVGHIENTDPVFSYISELRESRIDFINLDTNMGAAGNTNAGIEHAHGDYIALLDQHDLLEPDILFHYARAIEQNPKTDVLYCDEDTYESSGDRFSSPLFKMDLNQDLLYSYNYIAHFLTISRNALERILLPTSDVEDAQAYDITLKAIDVAQGVIHIPKVLYHRRNNAIPTDPSNAEVTERSLCAGKKALEDHFAKRDISAKISITDVPFVYQTTYIPDAASSKISIIIPNKDHIDYLDPCLTSIFDSQTEIDIEILIIENNSQHEETFAYYEKIMDNDTPLVKVLSYAGDFNYSKIINFGAESASGSHLLFLNNDTRILSPHFFDIMLGYFERPEVGLVGPMILFEDGLIQEAGMAMMENGWMGFLGQNHSPFIHKEYMRCSSCSYDYSAVLGACQLIEAGLFHSLGGYDESLAITYNDVDFCWRVREAGKLVVYSPYAKICHKEYGSRGTDDANQDRILQTQIEAGIMRRKWPGYFAHGDPFINPNLDKDSPHFKLGKLRC